MNGMKMTKEDKEERERWEAEDDLRTLLRAKEIKKDKPRLQRAMNHAKKQMAALKGVHDG